MNKVLIAIPTCEMGRRADFYDYINTMQKPEGTMFTTAHGQSPAKNRNLMIQMALENDCTHVMFIDDDVYPPPDMLMRLLAHDKDIVGALYVLRNYPHFPIMFDERYPDGRNRFMFLRPEMTGLVKVTNTGLGCVLIKTDVFRKIGEPWIQLGAYDKDHWNDDIHFFNRCTDAGIEIFVDTDISCGHAISAIIIPMKGPDGKWHTVYNTGSIEFFQVPQVLPTDDELMAALKAQGIEV